MSHNLQFKELLQHDYTADELKEHIKADNFTRYSNRANRANGIASFDESLDVFVADKGKGTIMHEIKTRLDLHDELQDVFKEVDELGGKTDRSIVREMERAGKDLKKNANKLYKVAGDVVEKHVNANAALKQAYLKAKADLGSAYAKEAKGLKGDALEGMRKRYEALGGRLEDLHTELSDAHNNVIQEAKTLIEDVESKTGIPKPVKGVAKAAAETESKAVAAAEHAHPTPEAPKKGLSFARVATGGLGVVLGYSAVKDFQEKGMDAWTAIKGALSGGFLAHAVGIIGKAR